jgi:hypothetical protein
MQIGGREWTLVGSSVISNSDGLVCMIDKIGDRGMLLF